MLSVDSGRAVLNISADVLAGVCCIERERLLMWLTAERWLKTDQTKNSNNNKAITVSNLFTVKRLQFRVLLKVKMFWTENE